VAEGVHNGQLMVVRDKMVLVVAADALIGNRCRTGTSDVFRRCASQLSNDPHIAPMASTILNNIIYIAVNI